MATYGSPTQIRAWTNSSYASNFQYDVIPYISGSPVTDDQKLNITTLAEADDVFHGMVQDAESGRKAYDQVEMKKRLVNVPS